MEQLEHLQAQPLPGYAIGLPLSMPGHLEHHQSANCTLVRFRPVLVVMGKALPPSIKPSFSISASSLLVSR